jgi:sigma-B regulation protein RsbU (phosphoserine phosphatase)
MDYFQLNEDNLAIILGDVMGKKWGAWYFTFAYAGYIRSSVRMILQNVEDFVPSKILSQVNKSVYQDSKVSEVFTTLSIVILDKKNMMLKYSGAGDLPLLYKESHSGKIEKVNSKGTLLGFKEDGQFEDVMVNLKHGDSFFMVTDGIMESRNPAGEAFSEQKFYKILAETNSHEDDFEIIKSEFKSFTGGQFEDDISMINIRIP